MWCSKPNWSLLLSWLMSFGSTIWPHMQLAYIVLSKVNSRKEMVPSVQLFCLTRSSAWATTVQQPLEPRERESRQMTILMILFQVSSWCLWAITFNFHYKLQDAVWKPQDSFLMYTATNKTPILSALPQQLKPPQPNRPLLIFQYHQQTAYHHLQMTMLSWGTFFYLASLLKMNLGLST